MPLRFSLKWLLAAVAYVAVAAAAFKDGWWVWADVLWGVAWLAWAYALLTVCFRRGVVRAGAAGFVILTAGYGLSAQFAPGSLPTVRVMTAAGLDPGDYYEAPRIYATPQTRALPPLSGLSVISARQVDTWEPMLRTTHSVASMLAGLAGLWLGMLVWRQADKHRPAAVAKSLVILATCIACGASHGQSGAITYVDATHGPGGNTKLATGEDFVPVVGSPVGNDNQWTVRPYCNGSSIYTSNDGRPSGPEDAPQLVTTITGLTPGERYGVFIYFWTDHHNWQIQASLEPPAAYGIEGPRVTPPGDRSAAEASLDMFNSDVIVEESNRQLMQAPLGRVAANDQGEIHVWVDDVPSVTSSNRTWYDGVGYVADPEPLPGEMGSLFDWWPWIVMLAVGFIVYIMITARRRGRVSIVDEVPPA